MPKEYRRSIPSGRYKVEDGRLIAVEGVPFVTIQRCLKPKENGGGGYFNPTDCDYFTHFAAAAPTMLALLSELLNDFDEWGEVYQVASHREEEGCDGEYCQHSTIGRVRILLSNLKRLA